MWNNRSSIFFRLVLSFGIGAGPALADGRTPASSEEITGSDSPAPSDSKQTGATSNWEKDPSAWKVAIYPIYLWAPVMGAHVDLENLPLIPGGPTVPSSGNASGSFSGAGFAAFEIQKSGWSGDGQFLYASVTGENSNPKVHLGMDIKYGQAMAGHTIYKGLSVEGGVRRMALTITAEVGNYPGIRATPGIWDPLVGVTWRYRAGKKWAFRLHVDGGGFGVGSDVSVGAAARADWRFAKHFGLTMGFAGLHFGIEDTVAKNTVAQRTLTVRQTLYGPLLGFGIYF